MKDNPEPGDASDVSDGCPDVADDDVEASIAEIASAVKDMVKADRKIGCLKTLQGHMWRKGYAEGKLKGQ